MEPLISSDLIRGHVDTIILHSLSLGDKSAQQIISFIEEKSNNAYQLNQATLYSSLKRLEGLKYLTSYWHDSENGRRKFFKITEIGNQTVCVNLSNWTYSRAIIDRLMDTSDNVVSFSENYCEPDSQIDNQKTEDYFDSKTIKNEQVISDDDKELPVNSTESTSPINQNSNNTDSNVIFDEKELNFRNIISGLVSACKTQTVNEEKKVLEPIKEEFQEKLDNSLESKVSTNIENVDLSNILKKATSEGLKVRISSKYSATHKGFLQINKVNFFSALIIALLTMVEFLCFVFLPNKFTINVKLFVLFLVVIVAFPLILFIKYRLNPYQCLSHKIYSSSITTALIVCFNIIFIDIALNILLNVDFANIITLFYCMILPISIGINSVIFYIIRFYLSKKTTFIIKNKK